MKKIIKNTSGFAMAELLIVATIVLVIFSMLFSNYLPLVAEYENRLNYTNITAQYASFYVRKVYNSVLDEEEIKSNLDAGISSKGYYSVYNSSDKENFGLITNDNDKSYLKKIVNEYGIEEIIITKSDLSSLKGNNGYKRDSGLLYNYISYLPNYKGKSSDLETYRIILKTSDYGFSNTQILTDAPTPVSCFTFSYGTLFGKQGFIVTGYDPTKSECIDTSLDVVIPSGDVTAKAGVVLRTSKIIGIGDNAFKDKGIKTLSLPNSIVSIGRNAFANNKLTSFSFKDNSSIKNVSDYAFSGNEFEKISLTSGITFGDGVFSNNYKLKKIDIEFDSSSKINDDMFALDRLGTNSIDLVIPSSVNEIGKNAFKNLKLTSIKFNGSNVKNIDDFAFYNEFSDDDNYLDLAIPSSVLSIGQSAFENIKLRSLSFDGYNGNSKLDVIGDAAFKVEKVSTDKIKVGDFTNYKRDVNIPSTVSKIGNFAFENQKLSSVSFEYDSNKSKLETIGDGSFNGNSFTNFVFVNSIVNAGENVFGESTLGNKASEIVFQNNNLSKNDNFWCNLFFGTTNSNGCSLKQSEENSNLYICTYNDVNKYVSYFIGGNNE